ncbi:MAG: type II toxin-antitoxin system RelE/ParE family toxin [Myxococcales bacterium]|nr:type II toxin-antitoxin system RelE/ParE family toxin [Myxococcales bacterium]
MQSFGDRATQSFFESGKVPRRSGWTVAGAVALRKIDMLHYAVTLLDLRSPPGNRLERLSGDWQGFHSIRINQQWRIVFRWSSAGPEEVAIVDYH